MKKLNPVRLVSCRAGTEAQRHGVARRLLVKLTIVLNHKDTKLHEELTMIV